MPSQEPSRRLRLAYGLTKLAAVPAGFVASAVSIMAAVGAATESIYARGGAAIVGTVIIPLAIADRLLPKDDPKRARGLVSDVFAVGLLGFALLFTAAGNKATRPLLVAEGDRLVRTGWDGLARVAYLLGGADVAFPPPSPSPLSAIGSSSAGPAAADAGAPTDAGTASDAGPADAAAASADAAAPPVPDAGAKGNEKSPAELFQDLSPSVVTIFVGQKGQRSGSGTGFVIDKEGTIATNHHVVKGAQALRIKFKSGAVYDSVDLLIEVAEADLALLRIDPAKPSGDAAAPPEQPPPLILGDSEKVVVGERAVSIGNPLGLEHTLTDGLVSSRRIYEGRAWIQMSVPISPGNSGGPLFNMRGEVIGISTATLSGPFSPAQNLNLAIPVNELKKLIQPSYPQRRRIGDEGSNPTQW